MIAAKTRITELFENKAAGEKIMSLFITTGYPDLDSTSELILGMDEAGADIIELGMPFSDPLADGPTIQYSSNVAIQNGTTMDTVFHTVRKVREKSEIPLVLMGYVNPVLHYGVEAFFEEAAEAGVDGVIIPDVPVEEASLIESQSKKHNINIIYLVAPNTSDERMRLIDEHSEGFIYCVSVAGVTGARDGKEVSRSVNKFIDRVSKNITKNPVLVGFGIRSHEDAAIISEKCDGFIVGSALIEQIRGTYPEAGWKDKLFGFVHKLKHG